jgi:acyl carrier protein
VPAIQKTTSDDVLLAVKRIVVRESRLSVEPASIAASEPLNGRLLKVTSLGLLGMLIQLEEDLGLTLPDDMFHGRKIVTVADLADLVLSVCDASAEPR